jgi:hypothetical protein
VGTNVLRRGTRSGRDRYLNAGEADALAARLRRPRRWKGVGSLTVAILAIAAFTYGVLSAVGRDSRHLSSGARNAANHWVAAAFAPNFCHSTFAAGSPSARWCSFRASLDRQRVALADSTGAKAADCSAAYNRLFTGTNGSVQVPNEPDCASFPLTRQGQPYGKDLWLLIDKFPAGWIVDRWRFSPASSG